VKELKEKYGSFPSKYVSIDNMNVHYRDEGNPSDTLPLILIHGTGSSLHTFDGWVEILKNKKRIIRMDIPGFGMTGPFPHHSYTINNYVTFIEHFLEAMKIKKCILGGNSLGGNIAWQFTVKNPEKIEKLILIDAAGYPMQSTSVPIAFQVAHIPVLKNILTFITPRFIAKSSVENVYNDKTKVTEEIVDRYFKLTLRAGNRQALVDRQMVLIDTSNLPQIKAIQQSTLVLWGEQDLLIPTKSAYRFHNDLPNDTLVLLKNIGHVPMEESPRESLIPLLHFLDI
jgi:pimeloyl-ACP methyl ester carboxylesterase